MLGLAVVQGALESEVLQLVGVGTGGAGAAALLFWYSWNHRIKTMEKAIEELRSMLRDDLDSLRRDIMAGIDRLHADMQRATEHRSKLNTEVEVLKARLRDAQDAQRTD